MVIPGADLRPLSLGELLDRTFTLYRNHFWLFVGIMVVPQVVAIVLNLGVEFLAGSSPSPGAGPDPAAPGKGIEFLLGAAILGFILTIVVYFFVYSVALGATTVAVSELYLGRPATIRRAYQKIRGRFWRLVDVVFSVLLRIFGVYLVAGLAFILLAAGIGALVRTNPIGMVALAVVMLLGFIAVIAFVVWVALRYGVAVPALLLENLKARAAMKRSVLLTRGFRGRVFLIMLLVGLISVAILMVFQGPFWAAALVLAKKGQVPLWLRSLSVVSAGVGGTLSGPLLMIALSLLYYDARVRKEAFDLQLMMAALEAAAEPSPGAVPPPGAFALSTQGWSESGQSEGTSREKPRTTGPPTTTER